MVTVIMVINYANTGEHCLHLCVVRDAVSDLALHFLAKMKIMVVKDIEREDIEFVCKVCRSHVTSAVVT